MVLSFAFSKDVVVGGDITTLLGRTASMDYYLDIINLVQDVMHVNN